MVVNNYFLKRQFKIYESFLRSDLEFEEIADDNPTLINHWLYPLGYLKLNHFLLNPELHKLPESSLSFIKSSGNTVFNFDRPS